MELAWYPWGVVAAVVVVVVVVVLCCCCCCCYYYCCSTSRSSGKGTRYVPISSFVESCDSGFELTHPHYEEEAALDHRQEVNSYDAYSGNATYPVSEGRQLIPLPDNFHDFIINSVIPSFNKQRLSDFQFAVLLLLSENDLDHLVQMTFTPSDFYGQPFLDKDYPFMPQEVASYGNYVVARPTSNSCHSEEEIFGKYSSIDSPFSNLWSVYVRQNHSMPKCILLYTWNLPCNRCTDTIIQSLNEGPYCWTSVIVAHTIHWRSETELEHSKSRDKLTNQNITVQQVNYPRFLSPA